jgi:hypothetical protein
MRRMVGNDLSPQKPFKAEWQASSYLGIVTAIAV